MCEALAERNVYVILSCNTFNADVSRRLHGRDLTDVKRRAIENLTAAGVKMTLLCVLIHDCNEPVLTDILRLMRENDRILSLTVQTMTYTGQGGGRFPEGAAHSGRSRRPNRFANVLKAPSGSTISSRGLRRIRCAI